jgi:hypothetical protein
MAGFKTHITFSTILGAGYGAAAYWFYDVPIPTCVLAGGLCGVSGMLPDLDSGPGRPLHESMAFGAAVVPMMLMPYFNQLGWAHELIILAGAAIYLLIRFGGVFLLHRCTEHRGMFHSLPAAAIFGEIAFLLASGTDIDLRLFKAGGVVLGFFSHLFLDEVYSFEWKRGRLHLKNSFGTAIKFIGRGWGATLLTYAELGLLSFVVLHEPRWMQVYCDQTPDAAVQQSVAAGGNAAPLKSAHASSQSKRLWPWQR